MLDLTTLNERATAILVDLLVTQLLIPRIYNRDMVDTTEVLLVVDEADALVTPDAHAVYHQGLSPLCSFMKRAREFGCMAAISVSNLAKASR